MFLQYYKIVRMFFYALYLCFFFTNLVFSDSVYVSSNSTSIKNLVFSKVESEKNKASDNQDSHNLRRLRQSVSENLNYRSYNGEDFKFSQEVQSYLINRQKLGQNFYIIESDLKADFSQVNDDEEPVGDLDFKLNIEGGDEKTKYRYMGYISHVDDFSTDLGLEFSVLRSRDFNLCSLDDEALLKVEAIQKERRITGSYEAEVYCVLSENLDQTVDIFYLLSLREEGLVEEIDVKNEFVLNLGQAFTLRHQISYSNSNPSNFDFDFSDIDPNDFEAPEFIFSFGGLNVGDYRLEDFNDQPGFNQEIEIEHHFKKDQCQTQSSISYGAFTPLNSSKEFALWEVVLNRICELKNDETRSFEISFGNNYKVSQSGFFNFFEIQTPLKNTNESDTEVSNPVKVFSFSYEHTLGKVNHLTSLNAALIDDDWTYDFLYRRSENFKYRDSLDFDFNLILSSVKTYLYSGVDYTFQNQNFKIGAGLTTDTESNFYASFGGSADSSAKDLNLDWSLGFPLTEESVLNKGLGVETEESFFQIEVGSSKCRPLDSFCWRGAIERIGSVNRLTVGGFIEF